MALPYTELYQLANDVTFQHRVQFALWRAANLVRLEDVGTPNHEQRLVWAGAQLKGPCQQMVMVMNMVCSAGQVYNNGSAVDDSELQTTVNGLVNDLAAG